MTVVADYVAPAPIEVASQEAVDALISNIKYSAKTEQDRLEMFQLATEVRQTGLCYSFLSCRERKIPLSSQYKATKAAAVFLWVRQMFDRLSLTQPPLIFDPSLFAHYCPPQGHRLLHDEPKCPGPDQRMEQRHEPRRNSGDIAPSGT